MTEPRRRPGRGRTGAFPTAGRITGHQGSKLPKNEKCVGIYTHANSPCQYRCSCTNGTHTHTLSHKQAFLFCFFCLITDPVNKLQSKLHAMCKYIPVVSRNIGERMRHTSECKSEIVHHIHGGYIFEGKQLSHAQHTTTLHHYFTIVQAPRNQCDLIQIGNWHH